MKSKLLSILAGILLILSLVAVASGTAWAQETKRELSALEETFATDDTDPMVSNEADGASETDGTVEPGDTDENSDETDDVTQPTEGETPAPGDQEQPAPTEDETSVTPTDGEETGTVEDDATKSAEDEKEQPEEKTEDETAEEDLATVQANQAAAQKKLDELAAAHANDLPAGGYEIVSKANPATDGDTTSYALNVQGGKKSTASNTVYAILYTAAVENSQRWEISYVGGGYALIKSVATGQYLSLAGGDNAYDNGSAQVALWDYKSGALYQRWIIIKQDDGSFKLVSALLKNGTDMQVLDVRGGKAKNSSKTIVYASKSSNDANQRWTIRVTKDLLDSEAQEHSGDLPEGTYLIGSSAKSSLLVNVRRNSQDDGGSVILYPSDTVTVNDGWDIVHNKNGYVTIISSSSGKALDVRGGKAKNGATVFQWANKQTGARNQLWIAAMEADGSYTFTSALVGDVRYVLSVSSVKSGSATILQPDKNGSKDNQHWVVSQAPEQYTYAHDLTDGTYLIRTALDMTKVLDVSRNSKEANAQVKLYTCKLSDNQFWIVTHDNQGYVRFKNKNSGLYLAFSSKAVDGSIITVQSSSATRWVAEPTGTGSYVLRDPKTGRCVDLSKNKTANGSKVIAYKATGGTNQKWLIAPASKIALDPGHGGGDSGAVGNGMRECDLTWSITQACAAQLRAYGMDVYITIGEDEFKNGATVALSERAERAAKAGCIALFSMHINAGGGTGAVVLVPNNSTYCKDYYSMGQTFAKNLMTKFNALGITTWGDGAWERDYSTDEGAGENRYYDGKGGLSTSSTSYGLADYYGIVRYARLKGMFGVIIEHGFIDDRSGHDVAILKQTSAQKSLGKADAEAIRDLYL